jgi:hypothetical protein
MKHLPKFPVDHPEAGLLAARRAELSQRQAAAERELQAALNSETPAGYDPRAAAAAELAGFKAGLATAALSATIAERRTRAERLREEIAVNGSAIAMLDQAIEEIRSRESHRIAKELRPRHEALVFDILEAALKAAALSDEELALREQLTAAGYFGGSLREINVSDSLGSPRDPNSVVSQIQRHAAQSGYRVPGKRGERP